MFFIKFWKFSVVISLNILSAFIFLFPLLLALPLCVCQCAWWCFIGLRGSVHFSPFFFFLFLRLDALNGPLLKSVNSSACFNLILSSSLDIISFSSLTIVKLAVLKSFQTVRSNYDNSQNSQGMGASDPFGSFQWLVGCWFSKCWAGFQVYRGNEERGMGRWQIKTPQAWCFYQGSAVFLE